MEFHPTDNRLIGLCGIDGSVSLHRFREEDEEELEAEGTSSRLSDSENSSKKRRLKEGVSDSDDDDSEGIQDIEYDPFRAKPEWICKPGLQSQESSESPLNAVRSFNFSPHQGTHIVCGDSGGLMSLIDTERPDSPVLHFKAWDEGVNVVSSGGTASEKAFLCFPCMVFLC